MRLVHFGHSCVLAETGTARLLFDPGTMSAGFEELRELDGILVTHQHADHLDQDRLPALLAANPGAALITDLDTAPVLADLGITPRVVRPGDAVSVGGAEVSVVGGEHAVVHPSIPVVSNAGYLVDHGAFYHPGDALFVPEQAVDVLGVPVAAPWLKFAEGSAFLAAVAPRVAVPIHEQLLANPEFYYGLFGRFAPSGTAFTALPAGEPQDL